MIAYFGYRYMWKGGHRGSGGVERNRWASIWYVSYVSKCIWFTSLFQKSNHSVTSRTLSSSSEQTESIQQLYHACQWLFRYFLP